LGLLGLKVGMTQVYDEGGAIAPVTVLQLGPCPVLQIRNQERDGYDALQLGFQDKPRRNTSRAERGHVAGEMESKRRRLLAASGQAVAPKATCEPQRYVREFRLDKAAEHEVGARLTIADVFKKVKKKVKGEKDKETEVEVYPNVDVIGTTKGRGFTGT